MHLGLSIMIASIAGIVIFSLWYPHPYFQAMGAWHVLRVLIGVDVVLGPLLTLVVFKPGKRGLKLDLTIIAILQLAALAYGSAVIYRERPYFTVFVVDRFVVLARQDVDQQELAAGRSEGRIADKPVRGPVLAVALRPTDDAGTAKLIDDLFAGKPDIERRPSYWARYGDATADVVARAQPLAALRAARPNAEARIAALPSRLGVSEERLGFLPMIAKNRDVSVIVDAATGALLEVLDVDPWIANEEPPPIFTGH